jgi:zinc-ribbon family
MAFIEIGTNQIPLGVDELLIHCPSCESSQWSDIMVTGKYFQIYWIPVFPIDKQLNIICKKCGLKRYRLPFNARIISNYDEIKSRFPHRWFTYSGIGSFVLIIITFIILRIVK